MSTVDSVLLHTSIAIELLGQNPAVVQKFKDAGILYLPFIARGELLVGAHYLLNPKIQREIEHFFSVCTLLLPNEETADIYGRIGGELKKRGTKIPANDLWIAALALQYDLPIAARDKHYSYVSRIAGLIVLPW